MRVGRVLEMASVLSRPMPTVAGHTCPSSLSLCSLASREAGFPSVGIQADFSASDELCSPDSS